MLEVVNGIRIAGALGIFKVQDFRQGHHERMPYDNSAMRSIYHIREYCVRKLSLLPAPEVFLSHDWLHQIEHYGDLRGLLSRKKFLRAGMASEARVEQDEEHQGQTPPVPL
ncbi:hypothetical protein D9615_010218 [Tricholomella constricta]|uniref:Uncharacterized protein n=1 Tax=Tricholomella constricta TaxID=117010 RepID=A0A8H5GNY3_9AGAR|nr:hypothetical protein D9615_010218 [Tricholomella constricta]